MKLLNEKYLQQRIEEFEVPSEFETTNVLEKHLVDELKQLLANCEEVEIKHIMKLAFSAGRTVTTNKGDREETYYDDVSVAKWSSFNKWFDAQGYKLIKVKQ